MIDVASLRPFATLTCWGLLGMTLRHSFLYHRVPFLDHKEGYVPTLTKSDLTALLVSSERILADVELIDSTLPLIMVTFEIIMWFQLYPMLYYLAVITMIVFFFPYLQKCSQYYPYCSNGIYYRSWHHHFMTSSLIYLGGAIAAAICGYHYMTFLCSLTVLGSMLYHRHREGQFFNMDNIFATNKLFLWIYVIAHAFDHWFDFAIMGVLSWPLFAGVFIYCGDPSEIISFAPTEGKPAASASSISLLEGLCCTRNDRPIYLVWHTVWHLISGMGPILSVIYLHFFPLTEEHHPYLASMTPWGITPEQCLFIYTLGLSIAGNIFLNFLSIGPMR